MAKHLLIGGLMILAGVGLLLPPAWMLFSPFLLGILSSSTSAGVTWLAATLGGISLLFLGVRRLVIAPRPSRPIR